MVLVLEHEKNKCTSRNSRYIAEHFNLKSSQDYSEVVVKAIPLEKGFGMLLPLSLFHLDDEVMIELLANWRKENEKFFPSQFNVTYLGTKKWLQTQVIENEDRILFLVLDKRGKPVAHLGFAGALGEERNLEVDNVVRGDKLATKGIMSEAVKSLIKYAQEALFPNEIFLKTLADNSHAINFYTKLGFVEGNKIPIKKIKTHEGSSLVVCSEEDVADNYYQKMVFSPIVNPETMILTAGPSISNLEISNVTNAVRNGWNHKWSDYIDQFQDSFQKYLGVDYALATSSCTGALHIALLALGVGPGDEVIVPDITWVATANVARYVGATPVFVDVEKDSWGMDPESFRKAITPKTKVVIPVHLYGHPANMPKIVKIAREHAIAIVEDAAPSLGAECDGKKTGTFGDFAAFSFQGAKLSVTGEGGMLVARSKELYEKAKLIWDQGRVPGTFQIVKIGMKYRMSNVQAALGLAQNERVEELIFAKRRLFSWYEKLLSEIPGIEIWKGADWAKSICWMICIVLTDEFPCDREPLRRELLIRKIDTRPVFPQISQYPIWETSNSDLDLPISKHLAQRGINLPSGVCLNYQQIVRVCESIREIYKEY